MAAELTRLTHRIAIQLHLMAESCTIYSSRSRRPARKLLDIPSYNRTVRPCLSVVLRRISRLQRIRNLIFCSDFKRELRMLGITVIPAAPCCASWSVRLKFSPSFCFAAEVSAHFCCQLSVTEAFTYFWNITKRNAYVSWTCSPWFIWKRRTHARHLAVKSRIP
jgi:hypothetical protein